MDAGLPLSFMNLIETSPAQLRLNPKACSYVSNGEVMATATRLVQSEELDLQKRSSTSRHFDEELRQRQRVAGQDEAVQALVDLYQDGGKKA